MVGDSLLVSPMFTPGEAKREVYLPKGEWYDYWTNEFHEGGKVISVPAPLERLPLFVKAGSVIPIYTPQLGMHSTDVLTYRIYPGNLESIFYEDQGEGMAYEQGEYRWVYLTSHWQDGLFLLNRRVAGRYVPANKSIRLEVVDFSEEPLYVRVDRYGAPVWFFEDGMIELTLENFQQLEIARKPSPTDQTLRRRTRPLSP